MRKTGLGAAGGRGATLTHAHGDRIDLTAAGSVSVDVHSVISVDRNGVAGSGGPDTGRRFDGSNGGAGMAAVSLARRRRLDPFGP